MAAGALPRPRPRVAAIGCLWAAIARTIAPGGKEGAGLRGDDDARDSTNRASPIASLCKIRLSDRKYTDIILY